MDVRHAEGEELRLTISDDGRGFDPAGLEPNGRGGGFGLFAIRERLGLLGGRVEVDCAPGEGCRITLAAPLRQPPAAPPPDREAPE